MRGPAVNQKAKMQRIFIKRILVSSKLIPPPPPKTGLPILHPFIVKDGLSSEPNHPVSVFARGVEKRDRGVTVQHFAQSLCTLWSNLTTPASTAS
jgi:hypothetical protein